MFGFNCSACLICLQKTQCSSNLPDPLLETSELRLERQLSVIYLLNKLLHIPAEVCANYLSNFGNPGEWICICADCASFVEDGRQLFNQIQALRQRHNALGQGIRLRMKVKREDDDEGAILGQPSVEIRQYLDTLDDLKDEEDLSKREHEDDVGWLIVEANLVDDSFDSLPQSEKKSGRKGNMEQKQNACNSRPQRSASKTGRYFSQSQFSSEGEEAEMELNLEESFVNYENEDSLRESDNDSTFTIKNEDCLQPRRQKKTSSANSGFRKKANHQKYTRTRAFHKKPEKIELNPQEIDAEPLSFVQVLEKHKELTANPEFEPKQRSTPSLARLSLVHKVSEFPCQVCSKVYNRFEGWDRHYNGKKGACRKKATRGKRVVSIPVGVQELSCDEVGCDASFGDLRSLENHMRLNHVEEEALRCKGCSTIFKIAVNYEKHFSAAAASDPNSPCALNGLRCGLGRCALVRSSQPALELHRAVYHAPERSAPRFKCLQCGDLFSHRSGLSKHIASQHDPSSIGAYPCPRPGCPQSFRVKNYLAKHLQRYHGPREGAERKFKCSFENCASAFYDKAKLDRHSTIHSNEAQFVCEICGKGFKIKNYLRIHSWQHDPQKQTKFKEYRKNQLAKRKRRLEKEALIS